ncbi:MAG: 50S ribosomal protein L11 methyltransferase [Chitinophagaceae bacterium]|nr:MAG: 50S ribosomal protein L11 methyltransferase [Chitinophagaceae bacterium]
MHILFKVHPIVDEQIEIISALVAEEVEGIEEGDDKLLIYCKNEEEKLQHIKEVLETQELNYEISDIPTTNWNALWESNFQPILIHDFAAVRAHFHEPIHSTKHEIIITPKMSFGTGHHATTYLMMEAMEQVDFKDKKVFDFGTGTGILAILAEKLGASNVLAIDIDTWCIENTIENIEQNNCSNIEPKLSDQAEQHQLFDVILANINKNVLLATIPTLFYQLNPNGVILLSGLLENDIEDINNLIKNTKKTSNITITKRNGWVCFKAV